MNIRVAITDDHPLAIVGLENMLQSFAHITITGRYSSGAELMEGLQIEYPDVLLLDIMLPDTTGKELTETIRKIYPDIRILALTSLDAPSHVNGMLRRGCLGYLLKNTDPATLIAAIEHVYKGEQFIDPVIKEQMVKNVLKEKKQHALEQMPVLSQREKEVLQLIVQEYTSQEIADKLFISLSTVESHRFSIFQKLDVKNMVGLVKVAIQMDLLK